VADRVSCTWDVAPAYDAVSAWLSTGGRASGLVCMNDRIAMGAYQALAHAGLSVPHDVSVVSFDNSELATWLRPRLTSVSLPYAEMGAIAVDVLLHPDGATSGITRVPMPLGRGGSIRAAVTR
jgi:LacI family transcriptional regulator